MESRSSPTDGQGLQEGLGRHSSPHPRLSGSGPSVNKALYSTKGPSARNYVRDREVSGTVFKR